MRGGVSRLADMQYLHRLTDAAGDIPAREGYVMGRDRPSAPEQPKGPDNVTVQDFPPGRYVLRLVDPVTPDIWFSMHSIFRRVLRESPRLIVLDLSQLTSLDTNGVAALESAAAEAGENDIALCLVGARAGPVGAGLANAHISELFEMFDSTQEALASVGAP